ncbi:hypothetical protein E5K00_21630 [Hymenobacter aquaticus]|uniref:CBM-cenC domain-containing protein n=1 Tax=Hymenobacter aquaticus TaxID=1867101 RepID=A0A4Z0PSE4_9BACT|nr:hypothetical protein [Hymenobacter aquaticus]TGE20598.1 hypothetical protein E5K00_21630 [Hymenobacter aquaticus]
MAGSCGGEASHAGFLAAAARRFGRCVVGYAGTGLLRARKMRRETPAGQRYFISQRNVQHSILSITFVASLLAQRVVPAGGPLLLPGLQLPGPSRASQRRFFISFGYTTQQYFTFFFKNFMRTLTASCSLLLTALLLTSCNKDGDGASGKDDKTLVKTDFDGLQGWVDNTAGSLTKKFAHSGRYSLTVGGGKEYGTTFTAPLGELMATKPRKVSVEAWVRTEEENTPTQLVIQVTKPGSGEHVFWKGLPLAGKAKPGEWSEMKAEVELPENISFDQVLKVYAWGNNAGKPVYLDDLQIMTVE